jgi:uncharacterized membrane protein YkoI
MKILPILTCIGIAAWATGCSSTSASKGEQDEAVPMSQVPPAVLQTLKGYASESDVKTVGKGDQDGTAVYEFDVEQGSRKFELTVRPDGKFMGTEEEIALAAMPQGAQTALQDAAKGGKATEYEKAVDENQKTTYEAVIDKGGKKTEVAVDAAGKVISTEAVTPGKD